MMCLATVTSAKLIVAIFALCTRDPTVGAAEVAREARNLGRSVETYPSFIEDTQGLLEVAKPTSSMARGMFAQLASPVQIAEREAGLLAQEAETHAKIAELGADLLAEEAETGAVAIERVMIASAKGARTGNATQIEAAMAAAIADAQATAREIYAATSPQASASAAMIGALVIILLIWTFELALAKEPEDRPKEEAVSSRVSTHDELSESVQNPRFLNALGCARYLAVIHVVLDNFWLRPDIQRFVEKGDTWEVFARWGVLSAPFFFVLGGFCSTYWKLVGPQRSYEEDNVWAMFRKVRAWYPIYALALTWCAVRLLSNSAEDWSHYLGSMALINGVLWSEEQYPYLNGSWWLCYFMVYLMTWSSTYKVLYDSVYPQRGASESSYEAKAKILQSILIACWGVCIPFSLLEWHVFKGSVFFALIQYWPSFIFGQALAFWFILRCARPRALVPESASDDDVFVMVEAREIHALLRFGPTIAYVLLTAVFFSFSPYDNVPAMNQPVTPLVLKGGLLPLFGILVLGLACEADPVARFFARRPFRWLDKVAFATFVLQVPVHKTVEDVYGYTGISWTFSASLFAASVVAHAFIERPWRTYLELRSK